MAQSQIIAKVSELSGQAFARDSAGNMRRLKLGDVIREGESVVAADGAKLVLALADGREMSVRPGETVRLDAEVAATVKPDAADSAVVNDQTGFQKIAKALQSGSDLDALLEEEAPAAGLVGQGGNEGHTFVELLRIVETVDPLAYQFGTNRGRPIETIEGAPVTVAAAGEPEQVLFARNDANAVSELVDSAAASKVSGNVLAAGAVSDVADSGLPGAVLAVTQIRFGAAVAAPGSVIALAHGTLVVAADGSYTYTLSNTDPAVNALNVGDQLSEQVTYTITDGLGHTAQANLTLTINGANDSPTATPSVTPIVATEDSSVAVPVGGSDPDSPIAFVTVTTLPTDGVLLKPDGTPVVAGEAIPVDPVTHQALLTFVPSANFSGPVSFPFTVTDAGGLTSAQATQQIDVTPVNDPPVAVVTPASGDEDTAITVNLSGTDIDGSIQSVTVTTLPPATQGVLYLPDGTTPVTANTPLNPSDAAGLIFKPAADFNGTVNIPFTVTDNNNATSALATAPITVNPVNDPPVAVVTPATGNEDSPIPVSLTGTDVDGTIQHVTVTTLPPATQGVLYLPDGTTPVTANTSLSPSDAAGLIFKPAADFNGTVNIPFTVTDNSNVTSAAATTPITVNPINDLPIAVVTPASGDEDTPIPVSLTGTDIDGTIQYVTVTTLPPAGQGVLYLADGTTPVVAGAQLTPTEAAGLVFQPAPDFNGTVNIPFTVTDNENGTSPQATAAITVNPVNDLPVGVTAPAVGNEDSSIPVSLSGTDIDGIIQSVTVTTLPPAGQGVLYLADGTTPVVAGAQLTPTEAAGLIFQPAPDFNGTVNIPFTVTDNNNATSAPANAQVTVTPINDLPVAVATSAAGNEGSPIPVSLTGTDIDGTIQYVTVTTLPPAGQGVLYLADGTTPVVAGAQLTPSQAAGLIFQPAGGFNGTVSLSFTVTDNESATSTPANALIIINPVNDPTLITGGTSGAGNEDNTISGTLTATDVDGLTDGSVYTVSTNAGHGTASIDPATGAWNYTPVGDYHGADSFTVSLTDDAGNTTTQVISLTIAAVADIQNDSLTTAEDTAVTILATSLLANDNFEGSPVVTAVGSAAHGTVALVGGNLTYTPNGNYNGPDSFTYTVTSPTGVTETATVNVTVTPANDPTLITGGTSGAGNEDNTISGTLTATDVDGLTDGSVYTVSTNAGHGTASIDPATGAWNYTPVGDYHGADSFTVSLTDDAGNTTTQVISLTIAAVADIQNDSLTTAEDTAVTILATSLLANDNFEGSPVVTAVGSAAHGTVALVGGNLTYTPNGNYNGPDSFTYTVTSPTGVTETATVNVTVTPANDPTLITGGTSGAGNEDNTISGTLTATDVDGLTDGSVYTVSTNAGHGTASIDPATGAWNYTPVGDYHGADSFTVSLTDDAGNTTTQVISLTIAAVADIQNDSLTTAEDTAVTILATSLLANDNFEGSPVVTAVGSAAHGTVALVGGNLTYTPNGNYNGPDSFTYTVTSPTGVTETATVNVTVTPANDPTLITGGTSGAGNEDNTISGTLTATDVDGLTDGSVYTVSTNAGHGTASIDPATGAWNYTPVGDYHGADSFTVSLTDDAGNTTTQVISLTIAAVADIADDNLTTAEDTAVTILATSLLGNDSFEGSPVVTAVGSAAHGTVALVGGNLTYTPDANYNGPDSFTYTVTSPTGVTETATVNVTVTPANDATTVTGGTSGAGNEDSAISGTLTATDVDGLTDGSVYTVSTNAGHGTASIDPATGTWNYTPVGDYHGADSFTVSLTDDAGNTTTQVISLTIAAVADIQNDSLTTAEDTAVTILATSLLANDNFEGSPVVTAVGSAAHGTVALVGGNLTYTPNGNYNGPDSFTYTVTSPTGVTETATVNVTVTPANDPTLITGGTSGAGNEDNTISGTLTATDVDGLTDGSVYTVSTNAGHGTASIDPATGAWNYTPVGDYHGADSFTVSLTDDAGNTTTQVISLTIAAVADIADDNLTTAEDTAVTILATSLLGNDSFEGSPVVTAVGSAAHGTVALVGGNLTYTPDANYNGPDSFTYTVTSPTGVTETATVNVTVTPANDATTVTGGTSGAGNEDSAISGTLTATDVDGLTDGSVYTVSTNAGHGTASIDPATGAWNYTPVGDYHGADSFTVSLTDDAGNTTTQVISLTIAAVADIQNDSLTTAEDTAVTILATSLLANDNFEGSPVVTAVGSAAHGTVALVGGNLTYTPNGNYNGPDSFTYTVTSPTGVTETATVNVTVTPANDPTLITGGTSGAGNEDNTISGTLTATDVDGLTDGSVYTVSTNAGHGTASIDPATGAWNYTPVGDYHGADSFTVSLTDDAGNTTTQVISLTIAAVADIADDNLTTAEDTAVTILATSLLGNDSFEGSPVVTAVGSAAHGTVALVGGNLTYTPDANYNGPDSFTYTVTSPTGVTETATVNVTVTPANDPTLITGGTSGAGNEDNTISGTLTATDVDGLTDGSVYTVSTNAGHGTASIDPATGAWNYTPVGDYHGADSFTVSLTDDAGNTTTQVISLTIAAVADIQNDSLTTAEDTAVTILATSLLANDNFEGSPVVTAVGSAAHGTVALVGGNLTYTPNGNYNGPDSFTYTVTSPTGVTETATVNVTVTPANDATTVTGGTSGAGNEDNTISGTLTATDVDGLTDGSVYTVSTNAGHGTASIDPAHRRLELHPGR